MATLVLDKKDHSNSDDWFRQTWTTHERISMIQIGIFEKTFKRKLFWIEVETFASLSGEHFGVTSAKIV